MSNGNNHRANHPSAGASQRGMESPDAEILVFRPRSLRDRQQDETLDEEFCDSVRYLPSDMGLLERHPSIEGSLTNLRSTGKRR